MDFSEEVVLNGDGSVGELRIKIRELPMADGVHASTGCQLWCSSIVLAEEILRRPELVAGKSVVEVGAGCGLLGIAVARLAKRTLLTDGDDEAVRNLQFNLEINEPVWRASGGDAGVSPQDVSTRMLSWSEVKEGWPSDERAEVVVGSDIMYGHWGDQVARACLHIVAPGGVILVVASEDRRSGCRGFQEHLSAAGWFVHETKFREERGDFRFYECRERQPGDPLEPGTVPVVNRAHASPTVERENTPPPSLLTSPTMHVKSTAPVLAAMQTKSAALPTKASPKECWRVVASAIVRDGLDAELSEMLGRVQKGALVREIERTDSRLHYTKLQGQGPDTGWVSFVSGKGVRLLSSAAEGG